MIDLFTECLIKRKKNLKDYAIIIPLITAGVLLAVVWYVMFSVTAIGGIALTVVVAAWWGIYLVLSNLNLEYEYIVTNGDIDIDVIYSQKKRKRLASFNIKDVEIVAPIDNKDYGQFNELIDASAHDNRYNVYYILANIQGVKTKVLINPSEKMLNVLKECAPRKIIIGEE